MTDPIDSRTGATYGDLVPPRSSETSKVEEQVRAFLVEAGYPVGEKTGVLCHHPDEGKRFLTLTPDVAIPEWRLAIEVDPMGATTRALTHTGAEEKDRLRNDLFAAVGWTVLRIRLGATEGSHLGERDVVVESAGFTKTAQEALREALDDFRADRPPRVRLVKKAPARKTERRSPVANIGEYNYTDGGHIFSWHPDLTSKTKVTLRLCVNGRYLYTHDSPGRFITEVGLHEVPRDQWKDRLTEALAGLKPKGLGTTKWPWGPTLLVPSDEHPEATKIIEVSEHEKHTLDRLDFWFTVSGHHVARWRGDTLLTNDEAPIASLHPDAVALGYRILAVSSETGRYGPYQRVAISRGSHSKATDD